MGLKQRKIIGHTAWYICLVLISIVMLYPVCYALLGSLKTNMEVMTGGTILPQDPQWENFIYVWEKGNFATYTWNSLILCASTTLGAVFISTMTAYCLERHRFPLRGIVYSAYLFTMFIALGAVTLRPMYLMAVDSGLSATHIPLIVVLIGSQGFNIFLVTRFINGLPRELDESAMLDGCNAFSIYWRIIFPLLKPIMAVVALFQFRASWNDYINSSVFTMTQKHLRPLTVGVIQIKWGAGAAAEWHLMMTGATISIVPIIIIYFCCNKYFMQGLTDGAVKG